MAKKKDNKIGFNIKSFIKGSDEEKSHTVAATPAAEMVVVDEVLPAPKKKSTPKKAASNPATIVPQTSMSYIQENIPYATAYNETNKQLDDAINQLNVLGAETMADLQTIRNNKTLKNKYNYINDMTSNISNIISNKINAIKEKNKTINDINNLELKRMKEMKSTMNEEDDNTRIANMYDAFINTPIGAGINPFGAPSIQAMTVGNNPAGLTTINIGNDQANWEAGLDPAQNRMVLEAKGAIETVVMYDAATGNRWYEVVDKQTRQPVPNVEKPSSDYIYDLDLNVNQGFAKDQNRQVVYPLIVINGTTDTPIISEY